jgi:hypothetical protein
VFQGTERHGELLPKLAGFTAGFLYGNWNSALRLTLLDGMVKPQWVAGFEL